jgi:hypothetical protein
MNCHFCAGEGREQPAVGVCRECGRAVCAGHSHVQRRPRYRNSGGGIGGPYVRCADDRVRLVCCECGAGVCQLSREP